jgi:hypothetical protein
MSNQEFSQYYAGLTDDQIAEVLKDRSDLVPDALLALDGEIQRRRLNPSETQRPVRLPDPDDDIHALEEDSSYLQLLRRKRFFDRFWYWLAFGPVALLMMSARYAYRALENMRLSFTWVALIVGYWLFLKLRVSAYTCPGCVQRFGPGLVCTYCGLPRTSGNSK